MPACEGSSQTVPDCGANRGLLQETGRPLGERRRPPLPARGSQSFPHGDLHRLRRAGGAEGKLSSNHAKFLQHELKKSPTSSPAIVIKHASQRSQAEKLSWRTLLFRGFVVAGASPIEFNIHQRFLHDGRHFHRPPWSATRASHPPTAGLVRGPFAFRRRPDLNTPWANTNRQGRRPPERHSSIGGLLPVSSAVPSSVTSSSPPTSPSRARSVACSWWAGWPAAAVAKAAAMSCLTVCRKIGVFIRPRGAAAHIGPPSLSSPSSVMTERFLLAGHR